MRSLDAARRADIALVLVDAPEGLTDQDLHVADEARKAGCATIVVVSKWDIQEVDLDDLRERLHIKLRQRPRSSSRRARHRRGVERLLRTDRGRLRALHEPPRHRRAEPPAARRPTREAPLVKRRRLKMLYGAQVQTRPPRFRMTVNDRSRSRADYAYYLENRSARRSRWRACP